MFKQFAAVILLCAVLAPSANAIKCYQCKSLTEPNCAREQIQGADNVFMVDCDLVRKPNVMEELLPVTKCNKVVTSDAAGKIISRDCHFEVIGQKPNECTVSHSRQVESCYTCNGDYCNGFSGNAPSTASYAKLGGATLLAATMLSSLL